MTWLGFNGLDVTLNFGPGCDLFGGLRCGAAFATPFVNLKFQVIKSFWDPLSNDRCVSSNRIENVRST